MNNTVWVRLPPALLQLYPDAEREVAVEARTVGEALAALEARWPGMRDRLCDATGEVRRQVNVFVAAERARADTPLAPGMRVLVMTALVGG